jgi:hypothetical protein
VLGFGHRGLARGHLAGRRALGQLHFGEVRPEVTHVGFRRGEMLRGAGQRLFVGASTLLLALGLLALEHLDSLGHLLVEPPLLSGICLRVGAGAGFRFRDRLPLLFLRRGDDVLYRGFERAGCGLRAIGRGARLRGVLASGALGLGACFGSRADPRPVRLDALALLLRLARVELLRLTLERGGFGAPPLGRVRLFGLLLFFEP